METRPAVLKSDWSRASPLTDFLVFVYFHTRTGCHVHVVLPVSVLWKALGEKQKHTENNIL